MTRRSFLGGVARGAGSALAAALLPRRAAARGQRRLDVLFISIDDLNDWVGVLGGHPQASTPHIDALARRGMLFSNAHCAAPSCGPSRAAALTGFRPSTSGIYRNDQLLRTALPEAVTLPQHFRQHGYRTLRAGKIFHGPPDAVSWQASFPLDRNHPRDPVPLGSRPERPGRLGFFDWAPLDVADEEMGDTQVVRWAAEQLAAPRAEPLFLGCGIFRPHDPLYVPRRYFEQFPLETVQLPRVAEGDLEDVPPIARHLALRSGRHRWVLEQGVWRELVQAYLAAVSFADARVGELVAALDASGQADRTLVVLWSDNGWHLGEKEHWRKGMLWEESTRIPLIVVAPGWTKPGSVCTRPVNLLDLYPTLAEVCGLAEPAGLDARSFASLLREPEAPWERPSLTTANKGNHAVRDDRWRYIRYRDGSEELYDHSVDPFEWRNLASGPEHVDVKQRLARWIPQQEAPPAPIVPRRQR